MTFHSWTRLGSFRKAILCLVLSGSLGFFGGVANAQPTGAALVTAPALKLLGDASRQWQRSEFVLTGVPLDGANPYDPVKIAVDAAITSPSRVRQKIPLFWYVGYKRALNVNGQKQEEETLTPESGAAGEWRLRWTPREVGRYIIIVSVNRGGQNANLPPVLCDVAAKAAGARGFVSVEPTQKRTFQTDDGKPLPLFGMNACWPGRRGTYDYDDWFPAMGKNAMNYTRLWQSNSGFRAELYGNERLNYNQQTLWQLDHVFDLAAHNGINIMLCMGFHGEFQTERDIWGDSGYWTTHAYQLKNGGPCDKPNDFFTDPTAAMLYQKRLRYLVARYGANTNLFSWQFFNEINNIYGDASASESVNRANNRLHPPDVVAWHMRMGNYLRSLDGYHHLVTTSLGSAGDQRELWSLSQLDYANWHWYGNWGGLYGAVTQMTAAVGASLGKSYAKPVVIAEFGTSGLGFAPENDTERRGLRQALWGGIFCGTAGTAMPWWWEDIHHENLYPQWKSLHDFLPASFGGPQWKVVEAVRPDVTAVLREALPDAPRFSQRIELNDQWGKGSGLPLILNQPGDGDGFVASGYVQGTSKPDLQTPFVVKVNLGANAKLTLHLNSVSNDAVMLVKQNGKALFQSAFPNKDNLYEINNEYNKNIAVPLQAGTADIEISNPGGDWYFLDWIQIDGALQAKADTATAVPLEHYVLSDGQTPLLWVVDSRYSWPMGRKQNAVQLAGAKVTLKNWPAGSWEAQWWHTHDGRWLGKTQAVTHDGQLDLPIVAFSGDVAARLTPAKASGYEAMALMRR